MTQKQRHPIPPPRRPSPRPWSRVTGHGERVSGNAATGASGVARSSAIAASKQTEKPRKPGAPR
jgi:hypothetical protein